ncbi:MAG: tetratricopeptide repeat protein [Flavobacteriales bacterium]|nr:tetratricopeptide repeat protein [Flavobacteriales bacterium]
MKKTTSLIFLVILAASLFMGCSQKKNNFLNRFFHNTNSRWNGLFNAKEAYKSGMAKLEDSHKENYRELLPLYIYGTEEEAQAIQGDMETVIKKCSRVIEYHSMDIKGKEYCKWIDESWMLIGKAYFFEKNYLEARPIFTFVAKKFKDSDTKFEARLWLVRTFIEMENFEKADEVIRSIVNSKNMPEEYLPEFKATRAHYHIKLEEYDKAILELEEAILVQKKKKVLTRWMFILGQLYAMQGETIRANNIYKEVVKKHPEYEMEFWAQMNRALSYTADDGSSFDIKKVLLKMLRDDKNIEYQDKLYYALSEVYEAEGEEDKQVRSLVQSTVTSVDDDYQKGLSFLTLAELYFARPEYVPAQAYYDSAVTYLPKEYPNRAEIENIQLSLKELVDKMIIIRTEDSLQALAKLPEHELEALIDEIIEQKIADEEKRREAEQGSGQSSTSEGAFANETSIGVKGQWYFYNSRSLEYGKSEFKKVWGGRINEDNWRRSDKTTIAIDEFESFNEGAIDSTLTEISDRSSYLKDIPFTEQAMAASNEKLEQAYYDLGIIYKERMSDNRKAVGPWRNIIFRFDTSKNRMPTLYQLYRTYHNLGNTDSANYFKNYILYRYPESDYAKIIKDPNYAKNKSDVKKVVEQLYQKAYQYYEMGYYGAAINKVDETLKDYPENELKVKLLYLKALSEGKDKSKEALIKSLEVFVAKYGATAEGQDGKKRIEILTTEKKEAVNILPPKYTYEPRARHLAVLIVPAEKDIESIKGSISNYHKAYHATTSYDISSVLLDKGHFMVSIKQFKDEDAAFDYYNGFKKNRSSLKEINASGYDFFIISYTNYALFFQDKRTNEYLEFMKKHYEL